MNRNSRRKTTGAGKNAALKRPAGRTGRAAPRAGAPAKKRSPPRTTAGMPVRSRPLAKTLAAFAVRSACAAFLGCNLLFTVPPSTPPIFKGYHTVYYRGARPLAEVVDYIRKQADVDAVVSRETAEVLYTDFSGLRTVPLARLADRFDARDPRLDDYMKRLGRYFTLAENGSEWNVFFVATRRNPLYLSLICERIAGTGRGDWYFYEAGRREPTVIGALLGTALFFCLLSLSRRPAYCPVLTAGILPWLHALAAGGIGDFMLFFFVAAYWAFFLSEYVEFSENELLYGFRETDKRPLFLRLGPYAGVLLVTLLLTSFHKQDLTEITLALFGQGALLAAHWGALRVARFLKEKKGGVLFGGFRPLAILRRWAPGRAFPLAAGWAAHAVVPLLCLIPLALFFGPVSRVLSLPLPRPVGPAAGITLSAIRRLGETRPAASLPDLSDFVRHAAFQERLAYEEKPAYELPAAGAGIVVSEYRPGESGLVIERSVKTLRSFDDDWLAALAAQAGPSSVEKMLFAQGRCLSVSFARESGPGFFVGDNWTIVVIFSIVLIPMILLQYTPAPRLVYGKRKSAVRAARKKR